MNSFVVIELIQQRNLYIDLGHTLSLAHRQTFAMWLCPILTVTIDTTNEHLQLDGMMSKQLNQV